jgi:ubiquinone/menaquinone biosynthesis C-methylase UbiE
MPDQSKIHDRAQKGFANSANYDEHRPGYTASAVDYLLQQLRVAEKPHAKILDLAAGTGKFTEALAGRGEEYEIVAVEPHEGMREVLERKRLPRVTVKDGVADKIPLEDESVDAVVVAQVGEGFLSTAR